jgi:predicted MPP superfamily phosphohydrolase
MPMNDEPPVTQRDRLHHALVGLHALTRVPAPWIALGLLALAVLLGAVWGIGMPFPRLSDRGMGMPLLRLDGDRGMGMPLLRLIAEGLEMPILLAGGLYLLFACADWAWLAALPRRNLSYGPVEPSLIGLAGARWLLGLGVPAGCRLLQVIRLWVGYRYAPWAGLSFAPWAGHPYAPCLALLAALQAALSALVFYATAIEPFRLGVTHLELHTRKLPPGARVRLVQISDLHVERITRRERALIERVNALQADFILLTGDYLNFSYIGEERAIRDARRVLGGLRAHSLRARGIYAVRGTHQVDPNRLMPVLFEGLDIPWLRNRHEVVERAGPDGRRFRLCFAGASCTRRREIDIPAVQRALEGAPPDAFTVLLFHVPDRVREAQAGGVDLYLAGHTHGGQLRLPLYGALLTATEAGKRHEMGRYDLDGLTLYVSRGIGMEGMAAPRARFLCPPEIVCVDVWGVDRK